MKLITTADTFLKALPIQVDRLKGRSLPEQLARVKAGRELKIVNHVPYEGHSDSDISNHIFFQLEHPLEGNPAIRWFVDSLHAKIEGSEPDNDPQDEPAPKPKNKTDSGPKISLPGISRPVGIYEPVYTASNFTWSEMTKGGTRIPVSETITQRIIELCKYMDKVRAYLGNKPIIVTSAYRDPASNRSVKGASDSRHMYGDAIDFYVQGMDVVDTFYKLKEYHQKGGLAVGDGFVHLDMRGSSARWTYPGGPQVQLW